MIFRKKTRIIPSANSYNNENYLLVNVCYFLKDRAQVFNEILMRDLVTNQPMSLKIAKKLASFNTASLSSINKRSKFNLLCLCNTYVTMSHGVTHTERVDANINMDFKNILHIIYKQYYKLL